MATAILILLWMQNEMSINRMYPKADRIYRMYNRDTFSGESWAWSSTPKIMGPTIQKDYPEVEDMVRISEAGFLFTIGDKKFNEEGSFVDPGFLRMFDFELLNGNPATALEGVFNIVLTESLSKRLFGNEDAIGRTIKIDSVDIFTVTGVLRDLPNTTSLKTGYLLPWAYMKKLDWDDEWWGNNSVSTHILLKENASVGLFNEKVKNITIDHTNKESTTEVFAYPLSRTYLYGKSENGQLVDGRIVTVRLFGVIAAFIVLIACINFMNLSTARSEKRVREVGVRKVVGAGKASLVVRFIGESILLAMFAGVVAILVVQLSLPAFNALVGKSLYLDYSNAWFWLQLLAFILFTGFAAGSYPAFFLSSFQPVRVLKGALLPVHSVVNPRKALVVLQFTFATVLIISTIIIHRQIRYGQERELGYDRDHLIYVFRQGDVDKHYEAIRQSLIGNGSALAVTKSLSPITQRYSDSWGFSWAGSTPEDEKLDFVRFSSDADFMKVMGTTLVEGRDIDINQYPGDSMSVLINETAVRKMRLENPVGQIIAKGEEKYRVVGVIKDFIFESPFDPVNPMMINGPSGWFNVVHIRLNPEKPLDESLRLVGEVFTQFNPQYPFEYNFADESYAKKFDDTRRTGTLALLFSGLTIMISCLGLFGLAAYMAASRIREIGIRKVLGASVASISLLLSGGFLKLVGIAFVIGAPIAWYLMGEWLQGYQYRMEIEWWIFAATGMLALLIALCTVSFQAIRAAIANPVKSLRSE